MLKLAVIIGDYSNGWSDSYQVQICSEKIHQKDCAKDLKATMEILNQSALNAISLLEANEKINVSPKDEPCCEEFKGWAKEQKQDSKVKVCPFCGKLITVERRSKWFGKEDEMLI